MPECAHKWKMKNKEYKGYFNQRPYWLIPCGKCVNCMINKTQDLQIRCEYEMTQYKHCSFMTITYDDLCVKINEEGIMKLCYKDIQDMLKRIRTDLQRGNLQESEQFRKDFKYLICGEYGDDTKRPHYHAIFFGIDFECKKIIEKYWKMGHVDGGNLTTGGIRYVLKYMHKSLNNKEMTELYDNNNLERPFQKHSLGLGRGLYETQYEQIKKDGVIKWHNKNVLPNRYYSNKLLIYQKPYQWQKISFDMDMLGYKREGKSSNGKKIYSKEQVRGYTRGKAYTQEINKIQELRSKGQPMNDAEELHE